MIDEHEGALTEELAGSLRAAAALTPRSADPYGPLGPAIARSRRRRTAVGASLAVVAVVGAAVGIGSATGRGDRAAAGVSAAAGGKTPKPFAPPARTATSPATSPVTHPAAPGTYSAPSRPTWTTGPQMMAGWPADYSLFPGFQASTAAAKPTVDAMIHAYGKPVGDGTRTVLDNLVGSFKLCGYSLSSYTFKLEWAGDLAHSGGNGAAVVDVSHGGAVYRMVGWDSYKGIWLQLPAVVDANEAAHAEAVGQAELDQPAQVVYAVVVAAPGSKVTVKGTLSTRALDGTQTPFQADPVTVGASGVAEVKLAGGESDSFLAYPTITSTTIVRPDGTTASVPVLGGSSAAQEQAARELLPANTTCPGPHPATPLN